MKRHDDSAPRPSYQPIWELGGDERLLDPGPGALGGGYDVLVVGGGVIGLATAALCRRAGLGRVAVVERGRLAAGPSGRGAGILRHRRPSPVARRPSRHRREPPAPRCWDRRRRGEWSRGWRRGGLLRDQARVDLLGLAVALARRAGTVATREVAAFSAGQPSRAPGPYLD